MRDEMQRFEEYAAVVAKAFNGIRESFPGLSLDNRLMIITPDDDFRRSLEPHLAKALQEGGSAGAEYATKVDHQHDLGSEL